MPIPMPSPGMHGGGSPVVLLPVVLLLPVVPVVALTPESVPGPVDVPVALTPVVGDVVVPFESLPPIVAESVALAEPVALVVGTIVVDELEPADTVPALALAESLSRPPESPHATRPSAPHNHTLNPTPRVMPPSSRNSPRAAAPRHAGFLSGRARAYRKRATTGMWSEGCSHVRGVVSCSTDSDRSSSGAVAYT